MTSVLIVDDDVKFRTTIGRDLGAHGFTVALANSASDAIALLADSTSERSIDVLRARHRAGDTVKRLAKDFAMDERKVAAVVAWDDKRAA